jgi:predicted nucleotidyltransferase
MNSEYSDRSIDHDDNIRRNIRIAECHQAIRDRLQIQRLVELCGLYSVGKLTAFGSALRADFEADSDIDFVVEFLKSPSLTPSKQYFGFVDALESLYGRQVDLVMRGGIKNPVFRQIVESQEIVVYAA